MKLPVPENELEFRYVRASGPGGQNVNKVSSAVQLRWALANTRALSPEALTRLRKLAANRISSDDVLTIDAREQRSQVQNRDAALARLAALLKAARQRPKVRRATQATKASKERRLQSKKIHGQAKKARQAGRKGDW